jgi:hypothetical protein
MGNIGKERRRIEVLPLPAPQERPSEQPAAPRPAEAPKEPAPAK